MPQPRTPRPPRPGTSSAARPYARRAPARNAETAENASPYARKAPVRQEAVDRADPYARKAAAANSRPSVRKAPAQKPRPRPAAVPRGPLSQSQKRFLRGLAHALKPVILVGQKGVTEAVLKELEGALAHHELIKVKLADGDREARAASIELIRTTTQAELIQTIGHIACFFRPNPDESAIPLPK